MFGITEFRQTIACSLCNSNFRYDNQKNDHCCVNPRNGLNSYWQMPFKKKCRITAENLAEDTFRLYYQIDYTLTDVGEDCGYFHAQFRRSNPLP